MSLDSRLEKKLNAAIALLAILVIYFVGETLLNWAVQSFEVLAMLIFVVSPYVVKGVELILSFALWYWISSKIMKKPKSERRPLP